MTNARIIITIMVAAVLLTPAVAQVKIGGLPGAPNPRAVLELEDSARGLLLPRLTQTQMNAVGTPPDGLLIFNSTAKSIYQYKSSISAWKPIVADSSEWVYDSANAKLYFRRALANQDSIYYNTQKRKFLFADSKYYRLSNNTLFNLDEGNSDKYIFKATASKFIRDTGNSFSACLWAVYEIDNDLVALAHPFETFYYGLSSNATVNPQATQTIGAVYGFNNVATHAGRDSLSTLYGTFNNISIRGHGYTDFAVGLNNSIAVGDSSQEAIGIVYGIRNTIAYSTTSPSRILSNYYGYFGSMGSQTNKIDGNAYGIFLSNVTLGGAGRNYALFTGKGVNRIGDSLVVTDATAARPRAVFDVNSTSAMILPAGTTVQRPGTLYSGMLRYNTDNASPEAYTGTGWVNLKNPVQSATALLDPPNIINNFSVQVNYTFTGAAIGNTVSVSPAAALPPGIAIMWATVTAANQVTVSFGNFSGAPVDLAAQNFYIKVIQ